MKKFVGIFVCTACAVALLSCEKEDKIIDPGYATETIIGESERTKTTIDNGVTLWAEGDEIKVICSDNSVSNFTLDGGAGTSTGNFKGLIPKGKTAVYAVYPAARYSSVDGTTVKVSIPAEQTGAFGAGNIAVAKVGSDHSMSFKNVNGFISFTIPADITKVVVSSVSGAGLGGTLSVACSGDVPVAGALENGVSSITTTFPGASGGTYYISVAPGINHSKGLLLTYYKGEAVSGTYYLNRNITTAANTILSMGTVEAEGNYYVTVSGAGNKNGMSWENACSAEQMWKKLHLSDAAGAEAVNDAKLAAIDGAVFHLGAGMYDFGGTPLLSFDGTAPLAITFKGGYPAAGGTQDLSAADNRACFSGANAHAALILRNKINVTFEGVNFVNGLVSDDEEEIESSGNTPKVAAALDAVGPDVSITMSYCDVSENAHAANGNWGAGIRLNGVGSFTADHVVFSDNEAPAAAALSIRDTDVTLENCGFNNNVANANNAGAVYISGSSTASFVSCSFDGNASLVKNGGAVHQNSAATSSFTDCVFTNNSAFNDDCERSSGEGYGGAVNITDDSNCTIENCSFSGNMAWRGGALNIVSTGAVQITGSTFSANGGSALTRGGGAAYVQSSATFSDCIIGGPDEGDGNKAKYGGAIHHVSSGVLDILGGTFQNNVANNCGGAICDERGLRVRVYDDIHCTSFLGNKVTADSADDGGGAIWAETGSTSSERNVSVRNAIFKGNEAYSGGAVYSYGNSTGTYFYDCSFGGNESGDPNYARGNSGEGGGGTLYMVSKTYCTMRNCTITGDHSKRFGGSVYGKTTGNMIFENCSFNGCYSSSGWGGAILTRKVAMGELTIKGGSFIGCHSNCGGAILASHTGKLAITEWNGTGTLFERNYADHASNVLTGGAIQIEGNSSVNEGASNLRVSIWKARFIDNFSGNGGAIYSANSGKPDIYIDRCSFDGNYITKEWGAVMATDGLNRLHINNSSIRNSYTTSTDAGRQSGNKPSWIAIYGNPSAFSISNSTIIGNPQYSSDGVSFTPLPDGNGLINFGGSAPLYLINNIIVPTVAGVAAVYGDAGTETVDMRYNQYSKVTNVALTNSGGNVSGRTASSFDGLSWAGGLWQWSGTIGGSAPSMITASDFINRLTAINEAYVNWIDTPDIRYDFRGVDRGSDGAHWWPGAYQAGEGAESLLKAVTWNIRSSSMGDTGDHAWTARRGGMAAFINDRKPQIICMQECEPDQRSYLVNNCSGYAAIYDNTSLSFWQQIQGAERSNEVILYNIGEISVLSSGTFWLTPGAPTTPSKSSSQNSYRSCTWMKCTYMGQKMLVMDVHLSYRTKNNGTPGSDEVIALRQEEMGVIKTWINGHYNPSNDGWLLFMGDMNTSCHEPIFDEWKDGTYGYFSRDECPGGSTGRTYNDWDWENGSVATIDFQFFKGFPSVKSYTIPTATYSEVEYLSDHWPVVAEYRMQ